MSTQPRDGIDLTRSGWTNPDGFVPEVKPREPAPPVPKVCGDKHPDGWECELRPNHLPPERHWADNGEPEGIHWERSLIDVSTPLDGEGGRTMQGEIVQHPLSLRLTIMDEVGTTARDGLANPSPAAWAVALNKIVERIYG